MKRLITIFTMGCILGYILGYVVLDVFGQFMQPFVLAWNPSTGATSYTVYAQPTNGSTPFSFTTTNLWYQMDTLPSGAYTFWVIASNGTNMSPPSNIITNIIPLAPVTLTIGKTIPTNAVPIP